MPNTGASALTGGQQRVSAGREVRSVLDVATSVQVAERGLRELSRKHGIPITLLQTHALHQATEKDDLELVQSLMNQTSDAQRLKLVNSPLGTHSYTPLCRAAYAGSVRLLKFLVAAGADTQFKNAHSEDIFSCLQSGLAALCESMPLNGIFLEARFEECAVYLAACQSSCLRAQKPECGSKVYVPRSKQRELAAIRIAQWWRKITKSSANGSFKTPEWDTVQRFRGKQRRRRNRLRSDRAVFPSSRGIGSQPH